MSRADGWNMALTLMGALAVAGSIGWSVWLFATGQTLPQRFKRLEERVSALEQRR